MTDCEARMIQGDCMAVLPKLPADHFHTVVTSPPYFLLRSYLKADDPLKPLEIGSEPDPESFIETIVAVFREVRRVLHPTGLLFLNLGDSYATSPGRPNTNLATYSKKNCRGGGHSAVKRPIPKVDRTHGMDGQLLNMPHRVAEALRADGWLWRQTIIWVKRSPMPESVRGWRWERCRVKVADGDGKRSPKQAVDDGRIATQITAGSGLNGPGWREGETSKHIYAPCPGCARCSKHGGFVLRKGKGRCTNSFEYIFVMSKTPVYFWDSAAFVEESKGREAFGNWVGGKVSDNVDRKDGQRQDMTPQNTRNPRSVWTLSSEPVSIPHFATYPSELVRRCIQAGTSDGGCCPECSEPWAPVVADQERVPTRPAIAPKEWRADAYDEQGQRSEKSPNRDPERHVKVGGEILGYRPTCEHYTADALRQAATLPRTKQARKLYQQDAARSWLTRALREAWRTAERWVSADKRAPCRVLDPFAGIGTTLQSAQWMQREGVGIELNPEYIAHAEQRIDEPPRWWKRKHNAKPRPADLPGQRMLF